MNRSTMVRGSAPLLALTACLAGCTGQQAGMALAPQTVAPMRP